MQILTNPEIKALNQNDTQERIWKIEAHIYWCNRGLQSISRKAASNLRRQRKVLNKRIKNGRAVPEKTAYGNTIIRSSYPHASFFENFYHKKNFLRIPGGDNYGFAMVNNNKMMIVEYCEGDATEITCVDKQSFLDEYQRTKKFFAEQ